MAGKLSSVIISNDFSTLCTIKHNLTTKYNNIII